jgi:putative ABC transport system ATP-binding protein
VIDRVNRELGTTTVLITHNAPIARMADRVISLSGGLVRSIEPNADKLAPSEIVW